VTTRRRWLIAAGATAVLVAIGLVVFAQDERRLPSFLRRDTTWQAMQERGTWRVGLDPSFPPFEMLDQEGRPVGYDVDLAQALAKTWGLEAEIVAVGFDSLPDTLKAGKIDSIVSAYPFDERLTQDYAFSAPYFDAGVRLAVRAGSPITTVADLSGRRVGVEWGSMGDMLGRQMQRDGVDVTLVSLETPADLLEALASKQEVDAIFIDNVALRQAQGAGRQIVAVDEPLESVPYVIVMPLRAAELHRNLEASLKLLQANGHLANLENTWFSNQQTNGSLP